MGVLTPGREACRDAAGGGRKGRSLSLREGVSWEGQTGGTAWGCLQASNRHLQTGRKIRKNTQNEHSGDETGKRDVGRTHPHTQTSEEMFCRN